MQVAQQLGGAAATQRSGRGSSRSRAQLRCRASAGDAACVAPLRRRAALAGAAAALLGAGWRVSAARAEGEDAAAASPLVAELLRRSAANKEANDKARRDYSKQYSGYFDVLKATSSFVPDSDEDRARLGYTRPPECNLAFFAASDLCKAFDAPK